MRRRSSSANCTRCLGSCTCFMLSSRSMAPRASSSTSPPQLPCPHTLGPASCVPSLHASVPQPGGFSPRPAENGSKPKSCLEEGETGACAGTSAPSWKSSTWPPCCVSEPATPLLARSVSFISTLGFSGGFVFSRYLMVRAEWFAATSGADSKHMRSSARARFCRSSSASRSLRSRSIFSPSGSFSGGAGAGASTGKGSTMRLNSGSSARRSSSLSKSPRNCARTKCLRSWMTESGSSGKASLSRRQSSRMRVRASTSCSTMYPSSASTASAGGCCFGSWSESWVRDMAALLADSLARSA
mmetsp:Transcript_50139/g.93358  ORF Transcript_50139/g.93358 Transcript_50139/m.93358 type:complete len:300 (-) Transcript_50139:92-991(-)